MKWDGQLVCKVIGGALIVNIKRLGNKVLISERSTDGTSLTNCIEHVIYSIKRDWRNGINVDTLEWYQWCDGEGLFKLQLEEKITRDMPPFRVVSWDFMSKDLTAFEVLFA